MVVSSSPFSYISIFFVQCIIVRRNFCRRVYFWEIACLPPSPPGPCPGAGQRTSPARPTMPTLTPLHAGPWPPTSTTRRGRAVEGGIRNPQKCPQTDTKNVPTLKFDQERALGGSIYMEKLPINRPSGRYVTPCCWRVGGLPPRSRVPSHSAPDSR